MAKVIEADAEYASMASKKWLPVDANELIEFIENINFGQDVHSPNTQINLRGLSNRLGSPIDMIDTLMVYIGNRCEDDEQIIELMVLAMIMALKRFKTQMTIEQLIRAAATLKEMRLAQEEKGSDRW